jgi:hypothetical protein
MGKKDLWDLIRAGLATNFVASRFFTSGVMMAGFGWVVLYTVDIIPIVDNKVQDDGI